jgi:hypothetical protein
MYEPPNRGRKTYAALNRGAIASRNSRRMMAAGIASASTVSVEGSPVTLLARLRGQIVSGDLLGRDAEPDEAQRDVGVEVLAQLTLAILRPFTYSVTAL